MKKRQRCQLQGGDLALACHASSLEFPEPATSKGKFLGGVLTRDIDFFCAAFLTSLGSILFTTTPRKMSDQSRQRATVFVGGLDSNVNEQTLHDAFLPFGEIVDVSLPKPEL